MFGLDHHVGINGLLLHCGLAAQVILLLCGAGVRQDNRTVERVGSMHKRGYRFFADEEDQYSLEDLLQALCFLEAGSTWVPPKPWEAGSFGARISELALLPDAVQKLLHKLKKED